MTLLVILTVLTVLVALYVTVLRPWMRRQTWAAGFFSAIEPIERTLWWNSETILWSRFKLLVGGVLTILVQIAGTDLSSIMPLIPEKHRGLITALPTIILAIDGLIGERLRRDTTKPLEVVAMRTDAPLEVKEAADEAAFANATAAQLAKETGAV